MATEVPNITALKARVRSDLRTALPGVSAERPGAAQVLADLLVGGVQGLYQQQQQLGQQLLPDSAEGSVLERWATLFGVQRREAAHAQGKVVFTGQRWTAVPLGLLLEHASGQRYRTTAAGTLGTAGRVSLAVRAEAGGVAANLEAEATLALIGTAPGVTAQAEVAAGGLAGGAPAESNAVLLERLSSHLKRPVRTGAKQDYVAWALQVEVVDRAWCFPLYGGEAGVVTVFITIPQAAGGPQANDAKLAEVKAHIEALAPGPVTLRVLTPTVRNIPVILRIRPDSSDLRVAVIAALKVTIDTLTTPGGVVSRSALDGALAHLRSLDSWNFNKPLNNLGAAQGQLLQLGRVTFT